MNNNNAADCFDFNNLRLEYSKDPKFIYIEESFKCLLVAVIQNLGITAKLIKNQSFSDCEKLDAGDIFNGLMIKNYSHHNSLSADHECGPDEVSDDDLVAIGTLFKQQVESQLHLKPFVVGQPDPIKCLFDLLHYFFIPIRLDCDTIPENIKLQSLREWITLVMTLPFQTVYSSQYEKSINGIVFLQEATEKMLTNEQVLSRISSVSPDFITKTIARNRTTNPTQHFIRLVGHMIIILSIETLRKYCPNIVECCRINPSYNGVWLNLAFDNMFQQQVSEITKITECFEITEN